MTSFAPSRDELHNATLPAVPDAGGTHSKAETARRQIAESLSELAEELTQGKSERLTAFLDMLARFHGYSFGNVMLIHKQRPDATRVAGYQAWKQLGRQVRKGERGITIIAPMVFRTEETTGDQSDQPIRFRAVNVFDVSQTDGEPLPEPPGVDGQPGEHLDRIVAFVASLGIELIIDALLDADGQSRGGCIAIRDGLTPAARFATIVHELAHEMLHKDDQKSDHRFRELEAESVAYAVCRAVGLDTNSACSDYIRFHGGDADALREVLGRVQKTAARILDGMGSCRDDGAEQVCDAVA